MLTISQFGRLSQHLRFKVGLGETLVQTVDMLSARQIWLVERLHVDLGRAHTMLCR